MTTDKQTPSEALTQPGVLRIAAQFAQEQADKIALVDDMIEGTAEKLIPFNKAWYEDIAQQLNACARLAEQLAECRKESQANLNASVKTIREMHGEADALKTALKRCRDFIETTCPTTIEGVLIRDGDEVLDQADAALYNAGVKA